MHASFEVSVKSKTLRMPSCDYQRDLVMANITTYKGFTKVFVFYAHKAKHSTSKEREY